MPFVAISSRRIEFARAGASAPGHPTLVFLHEGLGSVAMWKDFPEAAAARAGCEAVVYSRPGYGLSDPVSGPRGVDFMHREALEVLPAFLDALGIERPILVGHSDGGSIALICAGARARPLAGVATLAAHVMVEGLTVASIAAARQAYRSGDLRARLARYHSDVDATFQGWTDIWLHPDFRSWSIEDLLPAIACPVLAIQGREDEYGTAAQLERIAAGVPGAEILELADCRHSPHRDQPEAVIAALAGFVERVVGQPGRGRAHS